MTSKADNRAAQLRWGAYGVLITLAMGNITGRILAVNSVDRVKLEQHLKGHGRKDWQQQRPFLSANDRSRWDTIRALVEHGTYAIDAVIAERNWDTIDMVQHPDRAGVPRLYSSKPPLLPTVIAAEYWLIHRWTGCTLGAHPYEIGRLMLITVNVIPFVVMLVLLARLLERLGRSDWGRVFVLGAAAWGTFLTTFAVVLNNHLIAAVSATVALYAAVRILCDDQRRLRYFVLAGFFAAFTAACELPALAFLVLLAVILVRHAPRPTLWGFVPAAGIVVAGFLATNYAAHRCFTPPYMHPEWYRYTYTREGRERPSHWLNPSGIDRGEPSRATYIFHTLIGHHGIFSLTPIWLLSLVGLVLWARRDAGVPGIASDRAGMPATRGPPDRDLDEDPGGVPPTAARAAPDVAGARMNCVRSLAFLVAAVSIACLVFYWSRPLGHRNYGGMTSGFRWMFWLAPLWLLVMVPAADWMARGRWRRLVALVLLAASVLSASYPTWNPWTHPWITNLLIYLGYLRF